MCKSVFCVTINQILLSEDFTIMTKKPDIKTRKKLRYAMCVLYLLEIVVCTMPFIHYFKPDNSILSASPFFMITMLFGVTSGLDGTVITMCVLCIFMMVLPTIGFFFCALDKERNLKNLVSLVCCLAAVFIILNIPGSYMSIGAVFAIVIYVVIMFLTSIAMVMRLSKDEEEPKKK